MSKQAATESSPEPPTPDVFISYARADLEHVRRLAAVFEARGLRVFYDVNLDKGVDFEPFLVDLLERVPAVVVLWSKHAKASAWVVNEARIGRERGVLLPCTVDGSSLPLDFRHLNAVDLASWNGSPEHPSCRDLLTALERRIANDSAVLEAQPEPTHEARIALAGAVTGALAALALHGAVLVGLPLGGLGGVSSKVSPLFGAIPASLALVALTRWAVREVPAAARPSVGLWVGLVAGSLAYLLCGGPLSAVVGWPALPTSTTPTEFTETHATLLAGAVYAWALVHAVVWWALLGSGALLGLAAGSSSGRPGLRWPMGRGTRATLGLALLTLGSIFTVVALFGMAEVSESMNLRLPFPVDPAVVTAAVAGPAVLASVLGFTCAWSAVDEGVRRRGWRLESVAGATSVWAWLIVAFVFLLLQLTFWADVLLGLAFLASLRTLFRRKPERTFRTREPTYDRALGGAAIVAIVSLAAVSPIANFGLAVSLHLVPWVGGHLQSGEPDLLHYEAIAAVERAGASYVLYAFGALAVLGMCTTGALRLYRGYPLVPLTTGRSNPSPAG